MHKQSSHHVANNNISTYAHALATALNQCIQTFRTFEKNKKTKPLAQKQHHSYVNELVRLTNTTRRRVGCKSLTVSTKLCHVARKHNVDQMNNLKGITHRGSDGRYVGARASKAGYRYEYIAENVAAGQPTPTHVHRSLMKSKGHRKNITSVESTEIGIHVGRGRDGRLYWTQVFAKPR